MRNFRPDWLARCRLPVSMWSTHLTGGPAPSECPTPRPSAGRERRRSAMRPSASSACCGEDDPSEVAEPLSAASTAPAAAPPVAGEERFLWALTAEHTALQNARGSTIFETNGGWRSTSARSAALSSPLASSERYRASAIPPTPTPSRSFPLCACSAFSPTCDCVGSAIEDLYYARAIGRIRQYYRQLDPAADRYLLLSGHDDPTGVLANMGLVHTRWHLLSHAATMVLAVVAVSPSPMSFPVSRPHRVGDEKVGCPLAPGRSGDPDSPVRPSAREQRIRLDPEGLGAPAPRPEPSRCRHVVRNQRSSLARVAD